MKKYLYLFFTISLLLSFFSPVLKTYAQQETNEKKIAIYFTGIGCPHCSKVGPVLQQKIQEGGIIVIEYEIYKSLVNGQVLNKYADEYNLSLSIPQIMFDKDNIKSGDTPIINNLNELINTSLNNLVYLSDGKSITFDQLDLNSLERYPIIFTKDKVAQRKRLTKLNEEQNNQIKQFILTDEISEILKNIKGKSVKPSPIEYPGGTQDYDNALEIGGWLLQWNGESNFESTENEITISEQDSSSRITLGRIIGLGLADSVNPCALSILALVLISIITYNPGSRKQILLAGLSFVLAVLVMYIGYGFLIIKAFQVVESITVIRQFLYGKLGLNLILGIVASFLGLLGLKDFFAYKPGTVGTEMPLFLRPKMNKLVAKATSPIATFTIGLLVTVFLLPCTIGPYIILGGILAEEGFVSAVPSLLLYNFLFVSPMLFVTVLVYIGSKKAEEVKDWRDRNVRYMHLVAGILLLAIGILMILGIF
jgi:cytochrome c biogenesis protein CcdA/thiol-disulfide isomerase/thioredoxin